MWVQGETISGVDGIDGGIRDRRIEYSIRFDQAGDYRLYYRGYLPVAPDPLAEGAPSGNNDSFYVLSSFGDPSIEGNYTQEFPASLTNTWDWTDSGNTYTVTTAGEEVTWAWAQREDGPAFDRFVFSQTALSDGELDGLANSTIVPEPTTVLGLISLFVAAGVRRRRRSLVIGGA